MAGKDIRSGRDAQSLVGDLLRRATSPEVLAGVAGAAAAARFTKHLVEDTDEPEEAEEGRDEDDREEPRAEEQELGEEESDKEEGEEGDEGDDEEEPEPPTDEEEVPEAVTESEADDGDEDESPQDADDEEQEEAPDSSAMSNGARGTDDDRMEILDRARRYGEQLTGHQVEGFSSLEQDERGWRIGLEVVELSRVPSTTDVLGSYELVLTDDGDFVDFRRAHRYYRNSTADSSS